MNHDKKKAHSAVGAAEQAAGNGRADTSSCNDFNADGGNSQSKKVSSVLMHGENNAIPGKTLVALLGLKDLRELTQLIERERRDGFPICASVSGDRGYFLAETSDELERYLRSLDRRLKNIRATRNACEETLVRMQGQDQIDGW